MRRRSVPCSGRAARTRWPRSCCTRRRATSSPLTARRPSATRCGSASPWWTAVLGAGEAAVPLWAALGLRAIPIGRDVVVHTRHWSLDGRKFRNLRQAVRRTHNAGVTTQLVREGDIPDDVVAELDELRRV